MSIAQILFSLKQEGRGEKNHAYGHVKSVKVDQDFRGMGLGPLLFKEVGRENAKQVIHMARCIAWHLFAPKETGSERRRTQTACGNICGANYTCPTGTPRPWVLIALRKETSRTKREETAVVMRSQQWPQLNSSHPCVHKTMSEEANHVGEATIGETRP